MNEIFQAATLRDVAVLFDSLHKTPPYSDTGLPMIRVTDIKRGFLNTKNALKVTQEIYEEFTRKHKPQAGDIIFSRVGSYGNSSFVKNSEQFCLGQNTVCISPKKDVIDPFFLYCFLNSQGATKQIEGFVTGASQPTISLKSINAIEVPLVALDTQRRIASILSAYDDLIENNTRRIAILEEMARRIYEEWFVHFRFPGHEQVKMVESELGLIPEGWRSSRIGNEFKTVLGGTPSRSKPEYWEGGTIPWINSGKVNELRILEPSEFITTLGLTKSSTKLMPSGTTLLAITGATLGQVSLLEAEMCANQSVVGIIDATKKHSEFIYRTLQQKISEIIQRASGGAQQHINKDIVNEVPILLPTDANLESFNNAAIPLGRLIANLLKQNHVLRSTRDLLLPKLISGELDVSNLPEFARLTAPEEAIAA